jgi:hypothetical protein
MCSPVSRRAIGECNAITGLGFGNRLATTPRLAGSRGEFLKLLIPRNLRKRRLLQVSDLYRRFECLPLSATQSGLQRNSAVLPPKI